MPTSSDRFPYDLDSFEALVRLIQETYPSFGVTLSNASFDTPYFSPTVNTPGRTFVEMERTDTNVRSTYVYRRLDLNIALNGPTAVIVEGNITPRKIAEEFNRSRAMHFSANDVSMSDVVLGDGSEVVTYRMRALPQSFVWYGEVEVNVSSAALSEEYRLLEDGTPRLMEDGSYRLMEAS